MIIYFKIILNEYNLMIRLHLQYTVTETKSMRFEKIFYPHLSVVPSYSLRLLIPSPAGGVSIRFSHFLLAYYIPAFKPVKNKT